MANEFVIKNGYISKGNSQLSGSLDVSGSISASLGANTVGFYGTSSWAVSASWAPGATPTTPGGLNTQIQFNSASVFSGSSNLTFDYSNNTLKLTGSLVTTGSNTFIGTQIISGSINFGDGSKIQSISASSGDGGGYTTLTLKPDTSILSDQYIVLDPTSPNHIHIRAGGVIDSSSAYLYLGGEKANVVVQNLDGSFNEKYWVQINAQTGSTQYTWTFDDDGTLLVPGDITGAGNLATTGSNTFIGTQIITGSLLTTGSNIFIGTQTVTGSLFTTGSNTLVGNTILSGTLQIQGEYPPEAGSASVSIVGNVDLNGFLRFDPVTSNIDTTISASYIYVSGSTNDLYFSQNGVGYTNTTRLRWIEGNLYTGLLHGGLITTQSSTIYQVGSGSGIIVDLNASIGDDPYPTIQFLEWNNLTNTIDALSGSFDQQFVAISSSAGTAVIKAQGTPYVDGDYNDFIPIGIVLHQNRSTINGVQTFPGVAYGWKQRSFDFIKAFGALKISGYALTPSGSSTGSLVLSGGTSWVDGRNYVVDPNQPSYIVEATGITTSKIFRYYQSGSNWQSNWGYNTNGGAGYATIDPSQYSNAGTLTPVGSNKWTIQRVYYFPNSATKALFVYYGNAEYANEADALAAVTTEPFTEAPNTAASSIYVGYMILRNDANFTVPASYEFYQAGLFRGSGTGGAGGGGASTLAGLTDVSISTPANGDLLIYNGGTNLWNNTKTLSGSYTLSGSLTTDDGVSVINLTASFVSASSITGSLFGTASYAYTASYLDGDSIVINNNANNSILTATGNADTLDAESNLQFDGSILTLTGNQITVGNQSITGSLLVSGSSTFTNIGPAVFSGSVNVTNGITGSLFGTASYAYTASYVNGMITKNNAVAGGTFAGNPKKATVTFATPFPNASYSVTVTGEEARSWIIESKVSGSFIINSNSNTTLANSVYWQAISYGEFNQ